MYILSHKSHYFKVIYKLLNNAKKDRISIVSVLFKFWFIGSIGLQFKHQYLDYFQCIYSYFSDFIWCYIRDFCYLYICQVYCADCFQCRSNQSIFVWNSSSHGLPRVVSGAVSFQAQVHLVTDYFYMHLRGLITRFSQKPDSWITQQFFKRCCWKTSQPIRNGLFNFPNTVSFLVSK